MTQLAENNIETARKVLDHLETKYKISGIETQYRTRIAEKQILKTIKGKLRANLAKINK